MNNKIKITLLVIIILAGGIFFASKANHPQKYKTTAIKRGEITETVTASGTINPVTSTSVGTQVSGTIKNLYVDYNSPVKKGQLLAEINPSLFQAQVEQGQANLYNAQANLMRVKSIMVNDEKNYRRNKELYSKNFISRSELDLAESTYNIDKAQIASAHAQISQASAAMQNSLTNLRYTKIISPVNGTVISRNIEIGQTVAASFQTPTLFLVAQDLTKMQIDTNVAEADIGKIKVNQDVEYTLDGYPDRIFIGKVKQVRISPNTVQNVVTYDVVINVNNKDYILKPGMTANVSIITAKKSNILIVPNASLRFTPFKGENIQKFKTQGIWTLNCGQTHSPQDNPQRNAMPACNDFGDKKPERVNIKTGVSDGSFTEIISNKLKEGDQVITDFVDNNKNRSSSKEGGPPPGGMRGF